MALITCPECNQQMSDTRSACPYCGYVNENFFAPEPKKPKKKIWIVFVALLFIVPAFFYMNLKSQQTAYANAVSDLYNLISESHDTVLKAGNLTKNVWYNSIFKIDDAETDLFTKDVNGNFYQDFNTSLSSLLSDVSYVETVEEILSQQNEIKELYFSLNCPSEKYSQLQNEAGKLYLAYMKLSNHIVNCNGSLNSFTADFTKYNDELNRQYDTVFLLLYS